MGVSNGGWIGDDQSATLRLQQARGKLKNTVMQSQIVEVESSHHQTLKQMYEKWCRI